MTVTAEQCRFIDASPKGDMMITGGQRRQLRRIAVVGVAVILAPLIIPARPAAAEPRFTLDNPTATGAATAPAGNGWQTRIASFKLPGC